MKKMVSVAFAVLMMIFAVDVMAQPPRGGFGGPQFSPEQMAQRQTEQMTRELGLSPKQAEQVYRLQLERSKRMQEAFRGGRPEPGFGGDDMRQKMMQEQRRIADKYKRILSPQQYTKWEQMQQQRRAGMRGGHHGPKHMGPAPKPMHGKDGKCDMKAPQKAHKAKKGKR